MNTQWPLDTAVSFDPYFGEPGRDGDQGVEILPDGKVFFRIKAPAPMRSPSISSATCSPCPA